MSQSSSPEFLSRRSLLAGAIAGGAAMLIPRVAVADVPLVIVSSGQPHAVVVVPPSAGAEVTAAADDLVEYVQKATTATLPRITEATLLASGTQYTGHVRLYVGFVGAESDPAITADLAALDVDGFILRLYGNSVTLVGRTDIATGYAVAEFLESYVGVRWLMPGPCGEDVPTTSTLSVSAVDVTQEPVYLSRQISGLAIGPGAADKTRWLTRNRSRINGRVHFGHNLHAIFSPILYKDTHPGYFPLLNGVRYIPPITGSDYVRVGWQPTFSAPGTVSVAVQYILNFFTNNPTIKTFSLGVNDRRGFSEEDATDSTGVNSQGYPGKSTVYYNWVNQVVSQVVAAGHGDKTFGLLAYTNVADPPAGSFTLDPHVVPFITRDRYGWVDSAFETADKARLARWKQVATRVAWYDYPYGAPYAVPRVFPHQMAETLSHGAAQDVMSVYTELYPNWGEGPKHWLLTKLLWNPNRNVDTLLDEWYERAVGPAAAPYLKQYYAAWENFWTTTVPQTNWFERARNLVYFQFDRPDYLAAVTPELISQTTSLMGSVVGNTTRAGRANVLHRLHKFHRASALSYPRPVAAPATATAALSILDNLAAGWDAVAERVTLLAGFDTELLTYQPLKVGGWVPWHPDQLWGVVDYCRAHEPSGGSVTSRLQTDSTSAWEQRIRDFSALALQIIAGTATQLLTNTSFETASGTAGAVDWQLWVASTGTLRRTTTQPRTGTAGLTAHLLARGGPLQPTPVTPGFLATRVHLLAPPGTTWNGTVQIGLNLRSAAEVQIAAPRGDVIPLSSLAGGWTTVDGLFDVPAAVNGVAVAKAHVILILDGSGADADIYLDDFIAYQSAP